MGWMERIRVRLGFHGCLSIDKVSKGGVLALPWTDDVDLSISTYSGRHIDSLVKGVDGFLWHFTGIYGYPVISNRHVLLNLLRLLNS